MKIKYDNENIKEDDSGKIKTLSLSGELNGVEHKLKIKGIEDQVNRIKTGLKLEKFGQLIELNITNNQQSLEEL